jgi:butyrate kinase
MSPERSGTLPVGDLIRLCYSGSRRTLQDMMRMVKGRGGLMAHLGTTDTREVERRVQEGDKQAELIFKALRTRWPKAFALSLLSFVITPMLLY